MSRAQEFIDKYKILESTVRTTYHLSNDESIRNYLCNLPEFSRYQVAIACCQETRNLLQHQPMIDGEYPVEPSEKLIKIVELLTAKVLDNQTCIDICVKAGDVFSAKPNDSVKQAMAVMRAKRYSCIPILDDDGKVLGIFNEGSMFDYLADEEIVELDGNLRFSDLARYTEPNAREGSLHLFVSHDYPVDKLLNRIDNAASTLDRFEVAIVTNNGKPTEPMQGIITPWDLLADDAVREDR